ncbi:Holliday junction DNA helicase subunit RuvA [Thermanaeromonas toyohensis ToBE]|uniref:Holliday junction branch migration complex subunit RuvA n=1 Tax=Thermanaeromonas toyohensis ToBE TaxID=698762 RepID=A0A1W1W0I1_9FIRM|nr:Holliday junction branch migration protein RuvA [Thermanaeromonas toyohensis]SMB98861.1 Holliday junction DNA helicase subunit RuvA [Thermanaeromonas toyohensis ToBE]
MITFLRGKLRQVTPGGVVLEVNGVGFWVHTWGVQDWPPLGHEVILHTHMVIKGETIELYGFKTPEELNIFQLLLGVTGMGPKGAQVLASSVSPSRLIQAIVEEDTGFLTALPGIGPKKAKRLVVELKDRLLKSGFQILEGKEISHTAEDEVLGALVNLGYTASEVQEPLRRAREQLGPGASSAELLQAVLRILGSVK